MTSNGWLNEETEEYNLCLTNDRLPLADFHDKLTTSSLSVEYMTSLGNSQRMDWKDIALVDFFEIAFNQLSYLRSSDQISEDVHELLATYLNNSPLFDRHCRLKAVEHNLEPEPKPKPKPKEEKKEMNQTFETKHFVNDVNVATMSTADKIGVIRDAETHLNDLMSIEVKSKLVDAEIGKAKEFLRQVTEQFDALI